MSTTEINIKAKMTVRAVDELEAVSSPFSA